MGTKGTKITILGAGCVGATVAYTIATAGTCSNILLVDINKDKAKGEAMDIRQFTTVHMRTLSALISLL